MTTPALTEEEQLWVRRVEAQYPKEAQAAGPDRVAQLVKAYLRLREPMAIEEDKEMLRFLGLGLLITPEQRRSKLIEGVVRRILAAPDWDASKKLDFLYKHVVGRPVSPNEPDFGPGFVPGSPLPPG